MRYMKPKSGEWVTFYLKEEAQSLGIPFVSWRDAQESGQWILTDDGYVLQTKTVKHIVEKVGRKTRTRRRVITPLGYGYPHGKLPFEILPAMNYHSYHRIRPQPWWKDLQQIEPGLNTALVKLIMAGLLRLKDGVKFFSTRELHQFELLVQKYFLTTGYSRTNLIRYYNNPGVRMELHQQIMKAAEEHGWTVEQVLKLVDEATAIARKKQNAFAILACADRIGGVIGMQKLVGGKSPSTPPLTDTPADDKLFEKVVNDATE